MLQYVYNQHSIKEIYPGPPSFTMVKVFRIIPSRHTRDICAALPRRNAPESTYKR